MVVNGDTVKFSGVGHGGKGGGFRIPQKVTSFMNSALPESIVVDF